MIDCSRDGSYRRGSETRKLSFTGYTNVRDYRSLDCGRRMEKLECINLGIPFETCRCVINPEQRDHYLNPETSLKEIPMGVSHCIEEAGGRRNFAKGRVFVLDGGSPPRKEPGPENDADPHPLDEGW